MGFGVQFQVAVIRETDYWTSIRFAEDLVSCSFITICSFPRFLLEVSPLLLQRDFFCCECSIFHLTYMNLCMFSVIISLIDDMDPWKKRKSTIFKVCVSEFCPRLIWNLCSCRKKNELTYSAYVFLIIKNQRKTKNNNKKKEMERKGEK